MEIDPAMPKDAGYYECQSDNKFSIDRRGFIAKYELNQCKMLFQTPLMHYCQIETHKGLFMQ